MNKKIPADKLCVSCQRREIAPWSDCYCCFCAEDPYESPRPRVCDICGFPINSSMHYYCKKRRGLI